MENQNDKLQILITDLKKASEMEKTLMEISSTKITSPTDELLSYGFKYGIIKTSKDLLIICKEIPSIEEKATTMFDKVIATKLVSNVSKSSGFGGTYNSLKDAPGYGTIWNERCIPDDVHIKVSGRNRCGNVFGSCRC